MIQVAVVTHNGSYIIIYKSYDIIYIDILLYM